MMKNINAGALRHRVTLSRDSGNAQDSTGQVPSNYADVGTYYALVECLGGAEGDNADLRKGTLKYRVTLRAGSGPVYPSDRLVWNGHTINVDSAAPDPFGILIEVNGTEYPSPQ